MNNTVETIKDYILSEYGLDFKLMHHNENLSERYLEYKKGKKEYNIECGYAQSNLNDPYNKYWSIYHNFMDYKEWYGYGGAELDEGTKTIDNILTDWGFKKHKQLSIFDINEV